MLHLRISASKKGCRASVPVAHPVESCGFVVTKNGDLNRRTLTLGIKIGAMVEVRSGLANGEKVVLHPDAGFSDGDKVNVRQD